MKKLILFVALISAVVLVNGIRLKTKAAGTTVEGFKLLAQDPVPIYPDNYKVLL